MRIMMLAVVGVTMLALAGLFWWLRPAPDAMQTMPAATLVQPETQALSALSRVELIGGQRIAGPALLRVQQGDSVQLEFVSDANAELHLHGYDLYLQLIAGEVALLSFEATHSGRFEYELHGHAQGAGGHHALGVIEVLPR